MATLVLVRHGEIVRPANTSNFDRAPLSDRGRQQIESLASAWPAASASKVYASPLRRSIETAIILSERFGVPIVKKSCLKEWSPDESGSPQPEYAALEKRAWADPAYVPPSGESLAMATRRGRMCVEAIGSENETRTVAIAGHGTLFSLVVAELNGTAPSEAYKNAIGFAQAAILEAGSTLRLVQDFRPYGDSLD